MKKITLLLMCAMVSVMAFASASEWCDTATGHLGDPEFGDANSHILLTITKGTADRSLKVTIKPTSDNPSKGVSYLYVITSPTGTPYPAEVGDGTTSSQELSVDITDITGTAETANITVQYKHPGFAGTWMIQISDFDLAASCTEECELKNNPTMSSASLVGEAGFASATLSVAGVDEKSGAITKFIVKGEGFTEQQYLAEDGQIVISGLTPDTEYSLDVYAKDKCNNVSDNSINVEFTTAEATAECSGQRGHFGTPDQKKINFEIVSDSPSVGQATVTISPIDAADPLDYAEIQMNPGGNYAMDMATGGASASYTFTDNEAGKAIRFLYSLESLPGNEMTCDPLTASADNVILYTQGGCKGTAVDEAQAAELTMFPNPTSQYVNIAAAEVITNLIVRAQNGAVVAEVAPNDTFYNLDVTGFSTGRYFATIYFGQRFETQTILVK